MSWRPCYDEAICRLTLLLEKVAHEWLQTFPRAHLRSTVRVVYTGPCSLIVGAPMPVLLTTNSSNNHHAATKVCLCQQPQLQKCGDAGVLGVGACRQGITTCSANNCQVKRPRRISEVQAPPRACRPYWAAKYQKAWSGVDQTGARAPGSFGGGRRGMGEAEDSERRDAQVRTMM